MIYDAFGKLVAEYGISGEGLGGVKYVQQDWQGSVRAVANNNGFVVARTDHQAFGGDIPLGTGLRSIEQGYSSDSATRQGYGLTERDDASGLNHAWFRKNENSAGRWTSPDPYKGSMEMGDPQSFNRYSYVTNDPVNLVDPSGLDGDGDGPEIPPIVTWTWRALGGGSGGGRRSGGAARASQTKCYGETCGGGGGGGPRPGPNTGGDLQDCIDKVKAERNKAPEANPEDSKAYRYAIEDAAADCKEAVRFSEEDADREVLFAVIGAAAGAVVGVVAGPWSNNRRSRRCNGWCWGRGNCGK